MLKFIIYRYYSPNHKSYIGQTCQTMAERSGGRGQQYHASTKFYNAIQKYGWDWFKNHRQILAITFNQKNADFLEKYYIQKYDSIQNGYNIQSGGHFNPADFCSKAVIGINCQTKEILFFDSMAEASRTLNIDRRLINKVVNHELNHYTAKGYVWYSQEEWENKTLEEQALIFAVTPQVKNKARKVICLNNKKVYNSLKEAKEDTGINNISACCRKKIKSAGKINGEKAIWQYYDEYLKGCD